MLGDNEVVPTVAVRDLAAAKQFYTQTLGLKQLPSDEKEVLNFKGGNAGLLVYRSQFAGTNKATAVTWNSQSARTVVFRSMRARRASTRNTARVASPAWSALPVRRSANE